LTEAGHFDEKVRGLVEGNAMLAAATTPMLKSRSALRAELANLKRAVR